jgi:acetyltransferase-like isoleucine patch superfamily enzyme
MVKNTGNIRIGENVKINSKMSANPIGGDSKMILVCTNGGMIEICDGAGLSNSCLYATQSIFVGKQVMVGGGTKVYDTNFHSVNSNFRLMNPDPDIIRAAVVIKDKAFIGGHCIILKGVTIGENSVVGAGSVVTKDIPPNQVWAGNPAHFIKNIEINKV